MKIQKVTQSAMKCSSTTKKTALKKNKTNLQFKDNIGLTVTPFHRKQIKIIRLHIEEGINALFFAMYLL